MTNKITILLVLFSLFLVSCGKKKSKLFTLKDVEFNYEAPLYEGSNPGQHIVVVDLQAIFKDEFKEGMSVNHAVLKKAEVFAADSSGFDGISSFVMSLAADNAELKMQELAVINPLVKGSSSAILIPSSSAEATDYFAEKQFYLILDVTLAKDLESNLKLKGDFEFELEY